MGNVRRDAGKLILARSGTFGQPQSLRKPAAVPLQKLVTGCGFNNFFTSTFHLSRSTFHLSRSTFHALLVEHPRMHIRTMDRCMAAGAPAGALTKELVMPFNSYINLTCCPLNLGMAFKTKIRIAFDQQLPVHRAMRIVTDGAPCPECFVFKNKRPCLLAVTLRAILIDPRHCQSARRLEYVEPVRIMTAHATHALLDDRMMLRQTKFGARLKMTLKTGGRVLSRIDNELTATASSRDMFAAGPMACFASALPGKLCPFKMQSAMRAGRENTSDVGVAVKTCFVADIACARNFRRSQNRAIDRCAGDHQCCEEGAKDDDWRTSQESSERGIIAEGRHEQESMDQSANFKPSGSGLRRSNNAVKPEGHSTCIGVGESETLGVGSYRAQ